MSHIQILSICCLVTAKYFTMSLEIVVVEWNMESDDRKQEVSLFRYLIFRLFCVFCHVIFVACYNRLKKIKSL